MTEREKQIVEILTFYSVKGITPEPRIYAADFWDIAKDISALFAHKEQR